MKEVNLTGDDEKKVAHELHELTRII